MPVTEILSMDEAQALLKPLHDSFAGAHLRAWAKWQKLRQICADNDAAELLLPLSGTTRANYVNNHCVSLVKELVEPGDGVLVTPMHGLFTAVMAWREEISALVRFKSLNKDFRPSNVRTNVQRSLTKQEWPGNLLSGFELPTIPTVLTCGYRLTLDESEVLGVYVCCHYRNDLVWYYDLDDAGEMGGGVENLPLPNTPTPKPRIVSSIVPEKDEEMSGTDDE